MESTVITHKHICSAWYMCQPRENIISLLGSSCNAYIYQALVECKYTQRRKWYVRGEIDVHYDILIYVHDTPLEVIPVATIHITCAMLACFLLIFSHINFDCHFHAHFYISFNDHASYTPELVVYYIKCGCHCLSPNTKSTHIHRTLPMYQTYLHTRTAHIITSFISD